MWKCRVWEPDTTNTVVSGSQTWQTEISTHTKTQFCQVLKPARRKSQPHTKTQWCQVLKPDRRKSQPHTINTVVSGSQTWQTEISTPHHKHSGVRFSKLTDGNLNPYQNAVLSGSQTWQTEISTPYQNAVLSGSQTWQTEISTQHHKHSGVRFSNLIDGNLNSTP
jgi:hypothetical protein